MRQLISNSPVVLALVPSKPTVQSCLVKKNDDDVPRAPADSRLLRASPTHGYRTAEADQHLQGTPLLGFTSPAPWTSDSLWIQYP